MKKLYSSIELFAGAGGMALGLEKSGIECIMLNEINKNACKTLRTNRPNWNIVEGDIKDIDFSFYKGKVDIVTGGFPCQSFSYAGKRLGISDARGTLFYEFARAINEIKPLIFVAENVRGLLTHDKGDTLKTIMSIFIDIGYRVLPPKILKSIFYRVPQKRERLFIVGIREDTNIVYEFPEQNKEIYTLRDALKAGKLYDCDAPLSLGTSYSKRKREILSLVPPGGYWKNLPVDIQKEYMKKSFYLGGGKTGIARRLCWDQPCLTLTCSPAQKQTDRCHPDETRPLSIREYARIQTFPDDWEFYGTITQQYKQIGNAVPVNLAEKIGYTLINSLDNFFVESSKNIENSC